jgi:hypothetical protein
MPSLIILVVSLSVALLPRASTALPPSSKHLSYTQVNYEGSSIRVNLNLDPGSEWIEVEYSGTSDEQSQTLKKRFDKKIKENIEALWNEVDVKNQNSKAPSQCHRKTKWLIHSQSPSLSWCEGDPQVKAIIRLHNYIQGVTQLSK